MSVGILIAVILAMALLVPFLMKEIRKGKKDLGPRLPDGASEPHPGRRGNPAAAPGGPSRRPRRDHRRQRASDSNRFAGDRRID